MITTCFLFSIFLLMGRTELPTWGFLLTKISKRQLYCDYNQLNLLQFEYQLRLISMLLHFVPGIPLLLNFFVLMLVDLISYFIVRICECIQNMAQMD